MAATRTRLGSGPTLVVLAGVLAAVGSSMSGAGPSVSDQPRAGDPRAEAPIDGGSPHDLALPDLQGPGLDGAEISGEPEVAVQSVKAGSDPGGQVTVAGNLSIPARVLTAYQAAARTTARTDPSCHITWPLLASIGRIESGHARGGAVTASGQTLSRILGPQLSGGPGLAAIRDTDDGRYDGDRTWDRAVGPMQFIPSSWALYSRDGNGDGRADPHNVDDATLASAGYLCAGDRDLRDRGTLRRAVFGYNHSWDYVATVLAWMTAYDEGRTVAGSVPSGPAAVSGSGQSPDVQAAPRRPAARPASRPAPSPTPTRTSTPTARPNPTQQPPTTEPTSTPSAAPSSDPTETATPAPTGSPTPTPTPTETPTEPGCPTPSPSPTPTSTDGVTPTPTPTPTPTDTASPSPSPTGTATPDPCATPEPESEPAPTAGPTGAPTP